MLIYIGCVCINHVGRKLTQVSTPFKELSRHRNTTNTQADTGSKPTTLHVFCLPKTHTENRGWPGFRDIS